MSTRLERLQWVIDNRAPKGARDFARRAGLEHETHLSTWKMRLQKDPDADVEAVVLLRIAAEAGVRPEWLAFGQEPRDQVGADDPAADNLLERIGRAGGFSDEVIERALQTRAMGAPVPTDRAALDLLHYARAALEGTAPIGTREATDDEFMPAPKPAKKKGRR